MEIKMLNNILNRNDFAKSFETSIEDIPDTIKNKNFSYSIINENRYNDLILNILKRIDNDMQIVGAPERQQIWNNGWNENLENFNKNNYDLSTLIPKFIRCNQPMRYNLQYIESSNPNFELDYYTILREWLFRKYLSVYNNIYEFGCGTGFNLVTLSHLYPEKKLYGLDFVNSSINLVNKISEIYGYNINGHLFNMLYPNKHFKLEKNSAVFTIGSIEQLAGKFHKFIKYLLNNQISLCIHIEPIIELYNENILTDYLAIKFQEKRGYTRNFLPYLQKLEFNKIIDILKIKRLYFGNLMMEGYNVIIWRPYESEFKQ